MYLIYPDEHERCAGRLDGYPEDVRAWIESVRKPRAGAGGKSEWSSGMASVQTQTPSQQLMSARVKGAGIPALESSGQILSYHA